MSDFSFNKLQKEIAAQAANLPSLENWDPPLCGDIDMQINYDGSWSYMGTPITRPALVKLFASVLKREGDRYFLVTPVEKVGIRVADSPFVITQWQQGDEHFIFTTNIEDTLILSDTHPLKLMIDQKAGELLPYVLVRRNLWARLHQNVYYQLIAQGTQTLIDNVTHLTINSSGQQFSLGKCD